MTPRTHAILLLLGLAPTILLSACVTQREAKGNVRTRIGFDSEFLKSRGVAGDDSDKIRKKFADSGWTTNEEGKMVARHSDLYRDKSVGRGRDIEKKDAALGGRDAEKKYFKTPEYLERQTYATRDGAREGGTSAREGAFDAQRAEESGREADRGSEPGFLSGLNPFKRTTASESGDPFRASTNRQVARAQSSAPRPSGVRQAEMGFYTDSVNTMDDVKKLLHPEAFD